MMANMNFTLYLAYELIYYNINYRISKSIQVNSLRTMALMVTLAFS